MIGQVCVSYIETDAQAPLSLFVTPRRVLAPVIISASFMIYVRLLSQNMVLLV